MPPTSSGSDSTDGTERTTAEGRPPDGPVAGRRRLLSATASTLAASVAGCVGGRFDERGDGEAPANGNGTSGSGDDGPANAASVDAAIEVPDGARLDERIAPRVTGLRPEQRVLLTTRTDQPNGSVEWASRALYEAGADGVVDLATTAPIDGSYERADAMGPIWSMTCDLSEEQALFPHGTHEVRLSVRAAGPRACLLDDADDGTNAGPTPSGSLASAGAAEDEPLASATTTRRYPDAETEPLAADVVGTVHLPPDGATTEGGVAPGVLLLHGSGGQPLNYLGPVLAAHGYVAAAIQYFGDASGIPTDLAEVPLEYVQRAIDRLRGRDDVAGDSVGLYGISKGGELALLSGVHLDGIGAIASVVGSPYVWEGLTQNWLPAGASSWSIDGEPVDAIPFPEAPAAGAETIRANYEASLEAADSAAIEAATMPLEAVGVPTLLVSGGSDEMWPSAPFGSVAVDRLRRAGATFEYEHLSFGSAGHAIHAPYVPTYGRSGTAHYGLGGTPRGNATAAAEHWPGLLDLFDRALGE